VFNGTRWRTEIQPRIREFIRTIEHQRRQAPLHTPPIRAASDAGDMRKKANGHLNGANGSHISIAGE
jgi:poly(3-hydroxybutyrate) depolymerase